MPRYPLAATILFVPSLALAQSTSPNVATLLQQADWRAWLTDWNGATPLYVQAEKDALKTGDRRNALYAKFGGLRGQMQILSLADVSEQIADGLESAIAKDDATLRLRGFTAKGDIDLEWDVSAAQHDWERVRQLARDLGDKGWENRANGELGMVAFLKGNTGEASKSVQQAFQTAVQSSDIGGQLRYMGAIGSGIFMAGNPQLAMDYADRAPTRLRLSNSVVVLSACDTSVGPTIGQEGVQNLARAFLLAGAQSVVATLWSVSDEISMALMRSFYENLMAGQDIAQGLANAKRQLSTRFGPSALPTVSAFQVVGLGDHRLQRRGRVQTTAAITH